MNFKHDYGKLKLSIFPTIRGTGYSLKHGFNLGDKAQITSPRHNGIALYVDYQDLPIQDIPLSFLQFDASPQPIKSHQDFVDLINSFLPFGWGHNRLTTIKRIHWFKWIKDQGGKG